MKTKDVEINWNGKQEQVTLKRLTFGELNQLTEEATEMKMVGNQPTIKISQKVIREHGLLKSIIKAPFTIGLKEIQDMEAEIGNQLFEEFTLLNQQEGKKNTED